MLVTENKTKILGDRLTLFSNEMLTELWKIMGTLDQQKVDHLGR